MLGSSKMGILKRACANGSITMEQYVSSVHEWLGTSPVIPFSKKLGPRLAKDFRQVTPDMLMVVLPLVKMFMDCGGTSCVFQAVKLEAAIAAELSSNPVLLEKGETPNTLAYNSCNHIQCVASMLRYLKHEERGGTGCRRFPKTGGIRKHLSAQHLVCANA